jgi:hypothetical protein
MEGFESRPVKMPPQVPVPTVPGVAPPLRMVRLERMLSRVSPLLKVTTGALPPLSMMVLRAPSELVTVMALPLKSMFS